MALRRGSNWSSAQQVPAIPTAATAMRAIPLPSSRMPRFPIASVKSTNRMTACDAFCTALANDTAGNPIVCASGTATAA